MAKHKTISIWDPKIIRRALLDAIRKLNPVKMMGNPVMFVVEVGSVLTSILLIRNIMQGAGVGFELQITLWLWFTVLFANFAEAMAEGRGKAQAETLRRAKTETIAHRLLPDGRTEDVPAPRLRRDDVVVVSAGEFIPGDGEVIEGVASVDESAITGESAPVIREAGGDRSAVTGGTRVLSDRIKIRITSNPGETFIDRMIALVEGAERDRAQHPARRVDDHLPACGSDVAALRDLLEGAAINLRAGFAAGLFDPDHDRRITLGHRHCGNGPSGPTQRAGDVGARGRGGGRREYA